ncbi:hypothetical protein Tco_0927791 [Tanacetum coccineum]
MKTSDPVDTPMVEKSKLDANPQGKSVDLTRYRGMIGSLMYLESSWLIFEHGCEVLDIEAASWAGLFLCVLVMPMSTTKRIVLVKAVLGCGIYCCLFSNMLGSNMLVLFAVWAQKTFTTACGNNFEVKTVRFVHEKKKALAKAERSKGIELLSDATLLEEAQLKKALKRSKQDTNIHQVGGSSEGVDSESEVPDDPKGKFILSQVKYVHTPEDYIPTEDETNDESKEFDEEEYEELYGTLVQVVHQANIQYSAAYSDLRALHDYAAKYLNFDNIPPVDTEVVSMLDINVQHEVPPTTSTTVVPDSKTLTTLHQRVTDLEKDVKELKTVDHSATLLSTIKSKVPNVVKEYLGTSLDDALYKVLKKHDTDIIKEHSVPPEIVKRLRQQYVPEKSTEDIIKIKIEHARKQHVPKVTITSSDTTALEEFNQKTTLFETMTKSKSFNKSLKQSALYHALMELILEDEDAIDKGVVDKLKKRKIDNADKDEGSSARSDRGLKRQKTSKDVEPSTSSKSKESKSISSKGTKSRPKSSGKSTQAEESVFEVVDTEMPQNQGSDLGNTND